MAPPVTRSRSQTTRQGQRGARDATQKGGLQSDAGNQRMNTWIADQQTGSGGPDEYVPTTLSHQQQRKVRKEKERQQQEEQRQLEERKPATLRKKEADLKVLEERLARTKALDNNVFRPMMLQYVELLWESVRPDGEPDTAKESEAKGLLVRILDYLDGIRAFELPGHLHNAIPEADRDAQARERTSEVHLWSKMTQLEAIKHAETSGISLEGSLGGSLFDGLDFGRPGTAVMGNQWRQVSKRFASHTGQAKDHGGEGAVVHTHLLMGLPYDSVLYTDEWEVIKGKLASGHVREVVTHLYAMIGLNGTVKQMGSLTIRDEAGWQALVQTGKRDEPKDSNDKDEKSPKGAFAVQIGEVETPTMIGPLQADQERPTPEKRPVVANLSLYMNDADWERLRKPYYNADVIAAQAHDRHLKEMKDRDEVITPAHLEEADKLHRLRDRELDIQAAIKRFKKISGNEPLTEEEQQAEKEYNRRVDARERPKASDEYHKRYASPIYGGAKVDIDKKERTYTTTASQNLVQAGQMELLKKDEHRRWKGQEEPEDTSTQRTGAPVSGGRKKKRGPRYVPPAPAAPPVMAPKTTRSPAPSPTAAGPSDPVWRFIRAYELKLRELKNGKRST